MCRASTPFTNLALENPRKLSRAAIDLFAGSTAHGAPTDVPARDFALPAPALGARLYSPPEVPEPAPLLVFFHGGGFVFGSAAGHEGTCLFLAREAGVRILSVNYPLAPDNPCPAAHDAAVAAREWATANADRLGADPARIAVGGDSAGGNLAAHVALTAEPRPHAAFLLYPVTDLTADDPSRRDFGEGLLLTSRGMSAIGRHYGNGGAGEPHAVVSARSRPTRRRSSSASRGWTRCATGAHGWPST